MNKHLEKAKQFRQATPMVHNCAQAVLCAYAQELGLYEAMEAKLASNFGVC